MNNTYLSKVFESSLSATANLHLVSEISSRLGLCCTPISFNDWPKNLWNFIVSFLQDTRASVSADINFLDSSEFQD